MSLEGQGRRGESGYAMAALLVAMAVMAVVMSVALPAWRTVTQREKEEELIFRGGQYARAVNLYQRKFGNAFPPNFDALVTGRFLRKKYKDPITGGEFLPLTGSLTATQVGGQALQGGQNPGAQVRPPGAGAALPLPSAGQGAAPAGGQGPTGAPQGLIGVASKSTDQSIRLYNGRSRYNEWAFVAQALTQQPTAPAGAQRPGSPRPGAPQPGPPQSVSPRPGMGVPPGGGRQGAGR